MKLLIFWLTVILSVACWGAIQGQGFPAFISTIDLDGTNGFRIRGTFPTAGGDQLAIGADVDGGGDVNGDGISDLFFYSNWVFFGPTPPTSEDGSLELLDLDSTSLIRFLPTLNTSGMHKVVGDINGDGLDELFIGGWEGTFDGPVPFTAIAYLIFGSANLYDVRLDELDGTNGFKITGELTGYPFRQFDLEGAGDVNGDGFDDLVLRDNTGEQVEHNYVIFGSDRNWDPFLNLADLDSTMGFKTVGPLYIYDWPHDREFSEVAAAGDVNNDGFDDILLGVPIREGGGVAFVVFGKAQFDQTPIDLNALDGTNGFKLIAEDAWKYDPGDYFGTEVTSVGDINHDGVDDFAIAAKFLNKIYVVYGNPLGFPDSLQVSDLNGSNGFTINTFVPASDLYNDLQDISSLGDVNGDGIDDFIFGLSSSYWSCCDHGEPNAIVIFGRQGNFEAEFDLSDLDGTNGFVMEGTWIDWFGAEVSSAGDVNHDGVNDILTSSGNRVFVFYGRDFFALNFNSAPQALDIRATEFTLSVDWTERGTLYYAVLPQGSPAPTEEELITGVDGALAAGSFEKSDKEVDATTLVSGLQAVTVYDVYVVGQDLWNNVSEVELLTVTTSVVTSLEDPDENTIKVYPNPVNDRLFIDIAELAGPGIWKVELLNVLGKSHLTGTINIRDHAHSLDLSTLSQGFYLLRISNGREQMVSRIFKQ